MFSSYVEFFERATGQRAYPYQVRIAETELPDVVDVETGMGKTAAVVLGWLWRRRYHPDVGVRRNTPHWLTLCEPMRSLTEQAEGAVDAWLGNLGLAGDVLVHVALGGREQIGDPWRRHPEADAVVIGTLDMLLSRALNRGYGASRFVWPIDFGLLHSGVHWVYDETQLMGPALATSRQLDALRSTFGTAAPTRSTWMSATVERAALDTVDNPVEHLTVLTLDDADRGDPTLLRRLEATKTVLRLTLDTDPRRYARAVAEAAVDRHRAGTRTLVVLNTVARAREVAFSLRACTPAPVVLLHRRFRPDDRRRAFQTAALDAVDPHGPGLVVVATQVVEAGVDITSHTLITEVAPWPSIVQRAGRCNRDGLAENAQLWWIPLDAKQAAPYEPHDVERAVHALTALEGAESTPTDLARRHVPVRRVPHAVLRRSDLLGLFDTAPDLSGNDIDIAPFVRDGDELDVLVAWRPLDGQPPATSQPRPFAAELCPVPLGKELRTLVDRDRPWRYDHLQMRWERCGYSDFRPGMVLIFDAALGGYRSETGWDPTSRAPVPEAAPLAEADRRQRETPDAEESTDGDPLTFAGKWVELERHLRDVERDVTALLDAMDPPGLSSEQRTAAAAAGRLHDIGKAHFIFQDTMARCAGEDSREGIVSGGPWAKAPPGRRARHSRRGFRHELVSALMLLGEGSVALRNVPEPDLVVYLVAAHHGGVRVGIRSLPRESDGGLVLGVAEHDAIPAVTVPGGEVPPTVISLEPVRLGRSDAGSPSWSERALRLLGRTDLGPFRLAFLEAIVRLADWRASASESTGS